MLDRLSRYGAGLSPEQKNDYTWWKEAWDEAMVQEIDSEWPAAFACWMQTVTDSPTSNAFSHFMYSETMRVLDTAMGLAVPGA